MLGQWYRWHCQQVDCARRISGELQRTLLAVSRAVFQTSKAEQDDDDGRGEPLGFVPPVGAEGHVQLEPVISGKLVSRFGYDYMCLLFSWLTAGLDAGGRSDVASGWISSYHLFLDFILSTGHCGVLQVDKQWDTTGNPQLLLAHHSFKVRCRWWTKSLSDLIAYYDGWFDRRWTKPRSDILQLHCGCWWIRWSDDRLDHVEKWLSSHLKGVATRGGAALNALLPAKQGSLPQPELRRLAVR